MSNPNTPRPNQNQHPMANKNATTAAPKGNKQGQQGGQQHGSQHGGKEGGKGGKQGGCC